MLDIKVPLTTVTKSWSSHPKVSAGSAATLIIYQRYQVKIWIGLKKHCKTSSVKKKRKMTLNLKDKTQKFKEIKTEKAF